MRTGFGVLAVLALASFAMAQAPSFSGTWHCDAPSETHRIPVPGEPQHGFAIMQDRCTSSGGNKLAGEQLQSDVVTSMSEATPTYMTARGFGVVTTDSGDKLYVRTEERGRMMDGKPANLHGRWRSVGGTGKLRGVHAHGTYTVNVHSDATGDVSVKGSVVAPKM